MSWTGTTYNTFEMTIRIDDEKILECLEMARYLFNRDDVTVKDLEVFLGKLQHCCKFCPGSRKFMNRLLMMRREMEEVGYALTEGAMDDMKWFLCFLRDFNGIGIIHSCKVPTVTWFMDSSLVGGGALWKGRFFISFKWPVEVVKWQLSINDLELFNVLVSLRIWKTLLKGLTGRIWCDNHTSVKSLFSGKARNGFMAACLREMWYLCSTGDIILDCKHIAGKENNQADILSRAYNSPKDWKRYAAWELKATELRSEAKDVHFVYPDRI